MFVQVHRGPRQPRGVAGGGGYALAVHTHWTSQDNAGTYRQKGQGRTATGHGGRSGRVVCSRDVFILSYNNSSNNSILSFKVQPEQLQQPSTEPAQ